MTAAVFQKESKELDECTKRESADRSLRAVVIDGGAGCCVARHAAGGPITQGEIDAYLLECFRSFTFIVALYFLQDMKVISSIIFVVHQPYCTLCPLTKLFENLQSPRGREERWENGKKETLTNEVTKKRHSVQIMSKGTRGIHARVRKSKDVLFVRIPKRQRRGSFSTL